MSGEPMLKVTLQLPALYTNERDSYRIHTTVQNKGIGSLDDGPQEVQQPSLTQEIRNLDTNQLTQVIAYYPATSSLLSSKQWRCRAQVVVDGMALPAPYKPHLYESLPSNTPNEIDTDQIDWLHADKVTL